MTDLIEIAERLKAVIKNNGGYDKVSEKTGINRQTLIRIATGKTDPKLSQVMKIIDLSSYTMDELIYSDAAPLIKEIAQAERKQNQKATVHELVYQLRDNIINKQRRLEEETQEQINDLQKQIIELQESLSNKTT